MASSSSPWPTPARRLPLANRSNLSSAPPAPSPAPPRSSKLPPPPLPSSIPANKENAHPLLVPPPSPSTPHASSLAKAGPSRDIVRSSSLLRARCDSDAAVSMDGTPARPPSAEDGESSFSTPQCPNVNNCGLRLYSRRKQAGAPNLTMSCPPFQRHRVVRDEGDRPCYDFDDLDLAQGTSKRSKSRSRRRSLPEPSCKLGLPESFVAVQRAYFAEVDAFELAEEEAGSEEER